MSKWLKAWRRSMGEDILADIEDFLNGDKDLSYDCQSMFNVLRENAVATYGMHYPREGFGPRGHTIRSLREYKVGGLTYTIRGGDNYGTLSWMEQAPRERIRRR